MDCAEKNNRTIKCDGEYIQSEGLCLKHAVLFNCWLDIGGFRVYLFNPDPENIKEPTKAEKNPEQLRRWKRAQFHKWLNTLTEKQAQAILES